MKVTNAYSIIWTFEKVLFTLFSFIGVHHDN
jgi:hypothetical protein